MELTLAGIASDPFVSWRRLHAEGGVVHTDSGWLIGTYDLVKTGLANSSLVTTGALGTPFESVHTRSSGYRAFARFWSNALVMQQGQRHTTLREALYPGLALINQTGFQEALKLRIATVIDGLPWTSPFDLVEKLAAPLPVEVIAELLGVSSAGLLDHQADAETLTLFISGDDSAAVRERVLEASERLWLHFSGADADENSLLGELRRSGLRPDEIVAQSILVFLAGHQTLRDAICAVVVALSEFPEHQTAVREGTLPVARVIEEALRCEAPVQVAARTSRADLILGPAKIRAGERVLLCIGAANRDPHRYSEPEAFRPNEARAPSIVFGAGPHTCWGAVLAQSELRLVIQGLVARGQVHLNAPPERSPSLVFRKTTKVEIRIDKAI